MFLGTLFYLSYFSFTYGGYRARLAFPELLQNVEIKGNDNNFTAVHLTRKDQTKIKILVAIEDVEQIRQWWNGRMAEQDK